MEKRGKAGHWFEKMRKIASGLVPILVHGGSARGYTPPGIQRTVK
jgi:hypothetical protein